ncbi:MAG: processing protein DprA [Pseudomonadota bacterium]|jgi:DNA processing protein
MADSIDDALLWVALSAISGLGDQSLHKLLKAFGLPANIFAAPVSELTNVVNRNVARAIAQGPDLEALKPTREWLEQPENHFVTLADSTYPPSLLNLADAPPILYVKGRIELLNATSIAIVGSRNATPQGEENAEAFAEIFSQAGITVISGLALGIDAAAHRGGLRGNASTIAVVGTGLDTVYPARNKTLAHQIARHGALVSEFPLATPPNRENFPRRNRIISGLASGVLVVEAALSSGSLITARLAAEQGRDVFAIPGSIHSPFSKGCHSLIKQGAKLVESAQDVLEELKFASVPVATDAEDDDQPVNPLLQHMGYDPVSLDALAARAKLPAEKISQTLLELELSGEVNSLPGGLYQRLKKR